MALEIQQVTVGTAPVFVAIAPPNATLSFSVATGGATVYIGNGSALTTTTGFAVSPGIPHTFSLPPSSQSASVFAVGTAATQALGIIITTTS